MKAFILTLVLVASANCLCVYAEPSAAPNHIEQSGFCNALLASNFSFARSLLEGGNVDLTSPCRPVQFGHSPKLGNFFILSEFLKRTEFSAKPEKDLTAIGAILERAITSLGGVNSYTSNGYPLYLLQADNLLSDPTLGDFFLKLGADLELSIKAPSPENLRMATYSNAYDDPTGMTLLMFLCKRASDSNEFLAPQVPSYRAKQAAAFTSLADQIVSKSDINASDAYGRSALHHCILHSNLRLANKLLAKGARVDVRDAAGLSALDYGVATGDSELVDLLKNSPRAAPQKPTEQVEPTPTQVSDITPTHAVDVPDIGAKEQPALAPNPKATEEAADPLKISRELISAGNFEKAREILSELSKQGNSDAMYELGRLTIRGDGGKQNLEAARMLWEQAAERNHGASLIALAKLYYYGDGVPKSRSVSKLYIDRAKAQGASIPGELEK